ncbi:helix-turn-helix domain-containing protein [Streptomyces sp. WI04-05B]|uniref:helix-turn-helix domain-containing protein n=1 Tax=Streptomyces TaxID=1883 RepID=UPI0029A3A2DD|nr:MULTISPECIES: helix-turn-helix domain-containing protein [unclassified Streptomyces]MDX2542774.1 helix-turn-helix domain-containing protein [Streptomyces sp. WI04-05B]MDX2588318.1 helix-turn-helix domain-containing protein [Streptomyces sp. WI04-05A]MDX3747405.1 helix-turn-helix domain-containing protein [Streptomyces sp. AK08-02]
MIGTVFRSEDVPAEDRFDAWRELIDPSRPSDATSIHASDFRATIHLMELGPVAVLPVSFLPTNYRRTPKMIRRSDPERYQLSLLLDGGLALEHAARSDVFGSMDLHVVDSSHPYDLRATDDRQRRAIKGIGMDFPKASLPMPPHRIQSLLGRRLPGQEGVGALLTEFLINVGRQAEVLQPCDAPRLGTVLLDLVSAWFASMVDVEAMLPPETHRRVTAERVQAFIWKHLRDPELTPSAIASAHYISLSYLHRIFQQSPGEPVATWIRNRRLEGAHRDLANPALRDRPIHAVATSWCFPRASDFARAFRGAYGLSPQQHRSQVMSEHGWT